MSLGVLLGSLLDKMSCATNNLQAGHLVKKVSNYAQINGSGQVRGCVSGHPTCPEPSILAFSRRKIDKLGSRWHRKSL